MSKFTINTSKGMEFYHEEVVADSVSVVVGDEEVHIYFTKDGHLGLNWGGKLLPTCSGSNHLLITPTDENVGRCPFCGQHTTDKRFKTPKITR